VRGSAVVRQNADRIEAQRIAFVPDGIGGERHGARGTRAVDQDVDRAELTRSI
jgi:hypothetical protein